MKDTKYSVKYTEKALTMIKLHLQYLSIFDNNNAIKFKEKIIAASKSLEILPERFPVFNIEGYQNEVYRKMTIDKKYILIYQITESVVYIKYFIDCK